jgi:hypothetical protein
MVKTPIFTPKETLLPEGKERNKQIEAWKAQYGAQNMRMVSVELAEFGIEGGTAVAYIKRPGIATMTVAAKNASDDPMKSVRIMLNDCTLACDPHFYENEFIYLELQNKFNEIQKVRGSEIKNV